MNNINNLDEINIINQGIDTLKFHLYPNDLDEKSINKYNSLISDIKDKKQEAMQLVSSNKDERYAVINLFSNDFKVMATTIRGFSVTILNADISISFRTISSLSSNSPIAKIEFRAEYLARYGYLECVNQFKKLINFMVPSYFLKVSELHLCTDIQGYDFNHLDLYKFHSTARTKKSYSNQTFFNKNELTGFYLGGSDFLLRIYNKTIEINKFKDKGFIEPIRWENNKNYDKNKTVWRLEFQIRRKQLKELVSDDGLLDDYITVLNAIPDIWQTALNKFKHKNISDDYCLDMLRGTTKDKKGNPIFLTPDTILKRYIRSEYSPLWQKIQSFNETQGKQLEKYKEIKKSSKEYVFNAFKSVISTSMKLNRGKYDPTFITDLLMEANTENIRRKNLNLIDDARIKQLKYLHEVEYIETKLGTTPLTHSDKEIYYKNLYTDISESYLLLDKEPVNCIYTFEQYQKELSNVA